MPNTVPFPVEDENSAIWRYMDFTKFVSLLDKKSLFLCRAGKLEDSFEGSLPITNIENSKADFTGRKFLKGSGDMQKCKST